MLDKDSIERIKAAVQKLYGYAVWFWKWIIPDPSQSGRAGSQLDKDTRAARFWRATWLVTSIAWLIVGVTSAPNDQDFRFYICIGLIPVLLTAILIRSMPLDNKLNPSRIALCGAVCILLPYSTPGILYTCGVVPWGGNPWNTVDAAALNGAACLLMILLNFLGVYALRTGTPKITNITILWARTRSLRHRISNLWR